jgi:hypothetical protein
VARNCCVSCPGVQTYFPCDGRGAEKKDSAGTTLVGDLSAMLPWVLSGLNYLVAARSHVHSVVEASCCFSDIADTSMFCVSNAGKRGVKDGTCSAPPFAWWVIVGLHVTGISVAEASASQASQAEPGFRMTGDSVKISNRYEDQRAGLEAPTVPNFPALCSMKRGRFFKTGRSRWPP